MKPTVGRIVHYYDAAGIGPVAAIVTQVGGTSEMHAALALFWPPMAARSEPQELDNVPFHEPTLFTGSGYWVWPPRT